MQPEIIIAIISFCGTAFGTVGGILATSKLTNYRLQQLEEKVSKHNSIIERVYRLEEDNKALKEDIQELKNRRWLYEWCIKSIAHQFS